MVRCRIPSKIANWSPWIWDHWLPGRNIAGNLKKDCGRCSRKWLNPRAILFSLLTNCIRWWAQVDPRGRPTPAIYSNRCWHAANCGVLVQPRSMNIAPILKRILPSIAGSNRSWLSSRALTIRFQFCGDWKIATKHTMASKFPMQRWLPQWRSLHATLPIAFCRIRRSISSMKLRPSSGWKSPQSPLP